MTADSDTSTHLITVGLVDDHELFRQGVRSLLGEDPAIKIVGEASDAIGAAQMIDQLKPDVVILDIRLRNSSGVDVARAARNISPDTRIVVLTAYDDDQYVRSMMKLGVSGYLVKTTTVDELRRAVHDAAQGRASFPASMAGKITGLLESIDAGASYWPQAIGSNRARASNTRSGALNLSAREVQVVQQIALGLTNSEIAANLGISSKTVEAHIAHTLLKIGARNRTQVVLIALREGWLNQIQSRGRGLVGNLQSV